MSIRIFEQPNGRYAVWSVIVESFLLEDATEEELREWYIEKKIEQAEREFDDLIESTGTELDVEEGPSTYEDAVAHVVNR